MNKKYIKVDRSIGARTSGYTFDQPTAIISGLQMNTGNIHRLYTITLL
jgi:hypothetical protein